METTLGAAGVKDPAAAAAALAGQDIDWELLTDTFARGTDAVTKLLQSTSLNAGAIARIVNHLCKANSSRASSR